jgi:hypothetical protein
LRTWESLGLLRAAEQIEQAAAVAMRGDES